MFSAFFSTEIIYFFGFLSFFCQSKTSEPQQIRSYFTPLKKAANP